jgi:hypothetical protein
MQADIPSAIFTIISRRNAGFLVSVSRLIPHPAHHSRSGSWSIVFVGCGSTGTSSMRVTMG